MNENEYIKPEKWYDTLGTWIIIAAVIVFIILVALNNHVVGYDHYIGIPIEWARYHRYVFFIICRERNNGIYNFLMT